MIESRAVDAIFACGQTYTCLSVPLRTTLLTEGLAYITDLLHQRRKNPDFLQNRYPQLVRALHVFGCGIIGLRSLWLTFPKRLECRKRFSGFIELCFIDHIGREIS